MKIRSGFISNSSSTSFTVPGRELTGEQVVGLYHYGRNSMLNNDGWKIEIGPDNIYGFTAMDNGDLLEYMDYLGIDRNIVEWKEGMGIDILL